MTNSSQDPKKQEIRWIDAADNPWGVRLLDLRPFTQTMVSTSVDPRCAKNAVSFGQDDGTSFIGQKPPNHRIIEAHLSFPIDRMLVDGVLFVPRQMEHKWAIFYHREVIICVRSWQRKVQLTGTVEVHRDHIELTQICGVFNQEGEAPQLTVRLIDYLLRSHALDTAYPVPLPVGMDRDPNSATLWGFALFGNRALFATPDHIIRSDPDRPLRTHSLLHIAVARGNVQAIKRYLKAGVPVDLLAADGLAPLHWALVVKEPSILALLLDLGSPVDVRSDEGATPLMKAVQGGDLVKVRFLIEHGADVNAHDRRDFSSVHRAVELGHFNILQLLLDKGAESNLYAQGLTPRELANQRGRKEIVALLDKYIPLTGST